MIVTKEAKADFGIIEPGDGTRYTAVTARIEQGSEKYIYIALGAGDTIRGGYYLPINQLTFLFDALLEHQDRMLSFLLHDSHIVGYFQSKTGLHDWTAIVGVLTALTFTLSKSIRDDLAIIGHIYHNRFNEALNIMEHWAKGIENG